MLAKVLTFAHIVFEVFVTRVHKASSVRVGKVAHIAIARVVVTSSTSPIVVVAVIVITAVEVRIVVIVVVVPPTAHRVGRVTTGSSFRALDAHSHLIHHATVLLADRLLAAATLLRWWIVAIMAKQKASGLITDSAHPSFFTHGRSLAAWDVLIGAEAMGLWFEPADLKGGRHRHRAA